MYTANVIKKRWGVKPRLAKWLFTGIIRPKLIFSALIWGHRINYKYVRKKFTTLNRLAALATTSVRRSTPTLVILDLMPLDLFIKQNALAAWTRQKRF